MPPMSFQTMLTLITDMTGHFETECQILHDYNLLHSEMRKDIASLEKNFRLKHQIWNDIKKIRIEYEIIQKEYQGLQNTWQKEDLILTNLNGEISKCQQKTEETEEIIAKIEEEISDIGVKIEFQKRLIIERKDLSAKLHSLKSIIGLYMVPVDSDTETIQALCLESCELARVVKLTTTETVKIDQMWHLISKIRQDENKKPKNSHPVY